MAPANPYQVIEDKKENIVNRLNSSAGEGYELTHVILLPNGNVLVFMKKAA